MSYLVCDRTQEWTSASSTTPPHASFLAGDIEDLRTDQLYLMGSQCSDLSMSDTD